MLQGATAAFGGLLGQRLSGQQTAYRVGVGSGTEPYVTAERAMNASGEFPSVAGRIVVIKPNIVGAAPAETGTVTDPEVVRAVVDRALAGGAALVAIVETAPNGAWFQPTGYGIFENYDALNRVHLVDLQDLPVVLASVPAGWIYKEIYCAGMLKLPNIVFINVAKLKTHAEGGVTLASKNVFGLPDIRRYISPTIGAGRFAMHDRGVSQTIVDLNLLRPSHYAVIDGIWGMEGKGPVKGTPVRSNLVLAGLNALAVDRVGVAAMNLPQNVARHLNYLSLAGLGPSGLAEINVVGDALIPQNYLLPLLPPEFNPPQASAGSFKTGSGRGVTITTTYQVACFRKLEIVRTSDQSAAVELIRTLNPYGYQNPGTDSIFWNGRGDDGVYVPPGRYGIRATAVDLTIQSRPGAATSWITVTD